MVNEDTQGNVSQLQAEVKRLKEQLAQLSSGQTAAAPFLARGETRTVLCAQREAECGPSAPGTPP